MESLQPRQEPQRRVPTHDDSTSSQREQPARTNTSASSASSDSSEPVLLNAPRSQSPRNAPSSIEEKDKTRVATNTSSSPADADAEAEPRRCWICFNDETEDDETTSEWRSPCPCVLVAHERCLLDWIADMEAPNAVRQAGRKRTKILCPQCKSEIRLQRPRSFVVDAVRVAEKVVSLCIWPGAFALVGTATFGTLSWIGRAQIYQIFGAEDALRILAPLYQPPDLHESSTALRLLHDLQQHWRLHLGLPLIPTMLMASRNCWADSVLPFIPLIFFVSNGRPQDDMLKFSWPPSAAFTVAALPYIRGIYNTYYERVWLPREQKWLKEIQPRAGTEPEQAQLGHDEQHADDGHWHDHVIEEGDMLDEQEIALELELDMDIFADWRDGGDADNHDAIENPPVPIARGPAAPPLHAPPQDDDDNVVLLPAGADDQGPQQQPRRRVRRERLVAPLSPTGIADTVLGALIFPSIAAAVGEALKYALPKSWVTAPLAGKPTGFLQARWGRSILGGVLFVGVRDAVMLYVRWRMARNHRMRRVLDYDGKGKGKSRAGRGVRA